MNKHDNQDKHFIQDKTQHHTKIIIFNHKSNKYTKLPINTNAKLNTIALLFTTTQNYKDRTYKLFSSNKQRRITSNDNESRPCGWIVHIFK